MEVVSLLPSPGGGSGSSLLGSNLSPPVGSLSLGSQNVAGKSQPSSVADPLKPWKDVLQLLKTSFEVMRSCLEGEDGNAADYSFDGSPMNTVDDASAMLEAELKEPYVPAGFFVTPHVLLDFMKRHLYDKMHLSVKDKLTCNKEGLRVYDYWAA